MKKRNVGRGFTLVELLVVIAIIGILVALLLPAIQAAREAARRTECSNNLKNVALALQGYHDTYKMFPAGGQDVTQANPRAAASHTGQIGPSWWYGILPFIEQKNIQDKIRPVIGPIAATHATLGNAQPALGVLIAEMRPKFMRCPSSPLPITETQSGPIMLPSYVGIAGGGDIPAANNQPAYTNRYVLTGMGPNGDGTATASGMLTLCEQQNIASCRDGTSNTMVVAEQSDWLTFPKVDLNSQTFHGDAGWQEGWLAGTDEYQPVGSMTRPSQGRNFGQNNGFHYNVTVLMWPPGKKDVVQGMTAPTYNGQTITGTTDSATEVCGINNPIQAPHPGQTVVGMGDASVQGMSDTVDLNIAKRVAIRDDGHNVGEW
jgi:prepilin-type N-terminal cleavage/methylation domain-containing protein